MQYVLLILVALVVVVGWAISAAHEHFETSRVNKTKSKKLKEKWGDRKIDRSKSLAERSEGISQNHLNRLQAGYNRSYYIENCVRDCIQDIAESENCLSVAPNYEYLSTWEKRAPADYLALKDGLLKRFRARHEELTTREKQKAEMEIEARMVVLKEKYQDLISQFYEISERKVSLVDDYGDENWEALPKEIEILISKVAKKEGFTDGDIKRWKKYSFVVPEEYEPYKQLIDFLGQSFKQYHKQEEAKLSSGFDCSTMSGVEFEAFLVKLLKENGYSDVRGTPKTGDQGADLIAKKGGRTVVIQAKRHSAPVGNKAVQEVVSAVSFYQGDEGWVVTNSTFTKSAKELAQVTGTKLIDGKDLARLVSGQKIPS